jgi:hypothetical protein
MSVNSSELKLAMEMNLSRGNTGLLKNICLPYFTRGRIVSVQFWGAKFPAFLIKAKITNFSVNFRSRKDSMPAPTAIQSKADNQMEVQESGLKEGITLLFVKLLTKGLVDPTEIHIPSNDAEMHIDEENQPHFPPATQTVHTLFISLTIDVI